MQTKTRVLNSKNLPLLCNSPELCLSKKEPQRVFPFRKLNLVKDAKLLQTTNCPALKTSNPMFQLLRRPMQKPTKISLKQNN